MEGAEGAFCSSSFWLAESFAYQGRPDEPRKIFLRVLGTGNDLRICFEEFTPQTWKTLVNFSQGLTHLSLIATTVAIGSAGG
jgi:hypothetical protein